MMPSSAGVVTAYVSPFKRSRHPDADTTEARGELAGSGSGARHETPNVSARLATYTRLTTAYVRPKPRAVDRPAPASAPPIRAESWVTRDNASAPMRCAGGMVSPISALRMTTVVRPDEPAHRREHEHPDRCDEIGHRQRHQHR